jgi:hypothetical protein
MARESFEQIEVSSELSSSKTIGAFFLSGIRVQKDFRATKGKCPDGGIPLFLA